MNDEEATRLFFNSAYQSWFFGLLVVSDNVGLFLVIFGVVIMVRRSFLGR